VQKKEEQNFFQLKQSAYESLGFLENMSYEKRSLLRKECARFLKLSYLLDYLALDSLTQIFFSSIAEFSEKLALQAEDTGGQRHKQEPLFKVSVQADFRALEESELQVVPVKEFALPPFGASVAEDFDYLCHVRRKPEEAPEPEEEMNEQVNDGELEFERRVAPAIASAWLATSPTCEEFSSDLMNCIVEGATSLQNFERWSRHDDMTKYMSVLEEWDDVVGETWESPTSNFLNPGDWLEASPAEIFAETFQGLLDGAFEKCKSYLYSIFTPFLQAFWEN